MRRKAAQAGAAAILGFFLALDESQTYRFIR